MSSATPPLNRRTDWLTGDQLHRIEHCTGCPWLFIDHSKNANRRWCSMDDCGTSAKIRRYVERRAARRSGSSSMGVLECVVM
jgi:predicted RNA-binding Zn ribbon-like protein